MFVSKENLIEAFKQIHQLYSNNPDELTKQGCTQFFSGMRYFLAASAFEKRNMRSMVDSTDLQDKNAFIEYVGELVSINDDEYTCNFYNDFKRDEDYKVGSNFYSAGFVDDSRKNPAVIFEYPSRDKNNIILKASNGKFGIATAGTTAFKRKYLERSNFKYALIIWLVRNENVDSLTKEYVESFLTNHYTEDVAKALFLQDYSFLTSVRLVAEKAKLTSEELSFSKKTADKESEKSDALRKSLSKQFSPTQLIYYGVPGCGKSHKVEKEICGIIDSFNNSAAEKITYEKQVTRVVFHPDYCNADFIGQIVPVLDSEHHVKYEFKAGPFTQILRKAYLNPSKPCFLVIEEINRGNAAAIFGDVFQLLDRFKSGEHSKNLLINNENFDYTQGWSKYAVSNDDINGFIRQGAKPDNPEKESVIFDSDFSEDSEAAIKIPGWGDLHFSVNSGIRLPPNLSIYATMNTSDQNVFTLDNAFKRRFDSELIKNSLDGEDHKVQRETKIEGTDVTWGKFWQNINDLILEKHSSMTSSEDKRLGAYFIVGEEKTAEDGTTYREISKKLFGEKVLEYLWDDAFKYKRKDVFTEDCKSVESLIEKFTSGGFSAVFKNLEF